MALAPIGDWMSVRLLASLACVALSLAPAGVRGDTYPCTLEGLGAAVGQGGGPHALACTPSDTLVVPAGGSVYVSGDAILDLGGATIDFESVRAVLTIGPRVTCSDHCVRGPTSVRLTDFTLIGRISILTNAGFDPPGSTHATLERVVVRATPTRRGRIKVSGPDTSLHLVDSVLEGEHGGIFLVEGTEATIERTRVANPFSSALIVDLGARAHVVNSTFTSDTPPALVNGGAVDLRNTTVVASKVAYVDFARLTMGTEDVFLCGVGELASVNSLLRGGCTVCPSPGGGGTHSSGGNVESGGDTCGFDHPADRVDVSEADLALGPMEDGVYPLLPGSVAIDAGVDCPLPEEDQRGVARPQGARCDAGAYEHRPVLRVGIAIEVEPRRAWPWPWPRLPDPARGTLRVVVFGARDLDVRDVDRTTLAFGPDGAGYWRWKRPRIRRVDRDRHPDLVAGFGRAASGVALGDEACLTGALVDGAGFEGCGTVRRRPRPRWLRW